MDDDGADLIRDHLIDERGYSWWRTNQCQDGKETNDDDKDNETGK